MTVHTFKSEQTWNGELDLMFNGKKPRCELMFFLPVIFMICIRFRDLVGIQIPHDGSLRQNKEITYSHKFKFFFFEGCLMFLFGGLTTAWSVSFLMNQSNCLFTTYDFMTACSSIDMTYRRLRYQSEGYAGGAKAC